MEVANPMSALPPLGRDGEAEFAPPPVLSLDDFLENFNDVKPLNKNDKAGAAALTLLPKPVSTRSSKYTILLHEKYQLYALDTPEFTYTGTSASGWSGQLEYLGELHEEPGPLPSKPHVKESLSAKAVETITRKEEDGSLTKPRKGQKKKKKVGDAVAVEQTPVVTEPFVNYTGRLLEYQRSIAASQPTYTDYQLGTRFSCTCELEGFPEPLGSTGTLFSSKKAARQNAAKCAIEHLKASGRWPDCFTALGGIKKKKAAHAVELRMIGTSKSSENSTPGQKSSGTTNGGTTYACQVAVLATELGLGTPEWRYAEEGVKDFHTVGCYFGETGPVGQVQHIYGKKRAKEECAQQTLEYLVKLKQQREQHLREILGEDAMDEDSMAEQPKGQLRDEIGYSSDVDEFEDAEEDFQIKEDV